MVSSQMSGAIFVGLNIQTTLSKLAEFETFVFK